MIHPILFSLVLALLPNPGAAQTPDNCEPLRAQIQAKIEAKGVTGFALTVVPADAVVSGGVVGTCGNGTRKIVYAKGAAPTKTAPAAKAPATGPATTPAQPKAAQPAQPASPQRLTQDDGILTECKDGSVVRGGNCKN